MIHIDEEMDLTMAFCFSVIAVFPAASLLGLGMNNVEAG